MLKAPPYILVVDDHPDGREMLAEYLTFRGFEVTGVATGETALTQALERVPALILMALEMPGIGGWEATRQLRAHPATKDVIVIALTAHALFPDHRIARQAGCDAFVSKPFDILALGDAIADVMRRGRTGLATVEALTPLQNETARRPRTAPGSWASDQRPRSAPVHRRRL
jgi:two-component system, cell cycle response regulator DivK